MPPLAAAGKAVSPGMGSIIGAGTGLLGSIINLVGAKKRQKRGFAHDRAMAQQAYGHDIDMWNRQSNWNLAMWRLQNEYNLPANAMQRLRDAGLNPNLIAGQGAAGGQASSIQPATMPNYQQVRSNYSWPGFQMPNLLGLYQGIRQNNAQVDNMKSVTELNEQRAITEAIKQHGMGYDNSIKYANAKYSQQMAKLEVDRRLQQLTNMGLDQSIKRHMVGRTGAEAGLKQMEYEFFKNLGIKGLRDVAPMLQLLFRSFRGN